MIPDKLNFLTAGIPLRTEGSYPEALDILETMSLDGMEVEFVHGVRMTAETRENVRKIAKAKNLMLTAHAPYYINLNAREQEKIDASVVRIIETAQAAHDFGGFSITFHAAFYLGQDKETVFKQVEAQMQRITAILAQNNIDIWIRPETTGKNSQWGDLGEIIRLSKSFDKVLPCIDFAHLHARSGGKFNTYDEFSKILDTVSKELGEVAINNFHAHLAGIDYSDKGEKHHLVLENSDMNYKDLLKVFKEFGVKGALVCESPNIEDDTKLLKEYYESL